MNYRQQIMIFTAIIASSFAAGAQEVYESVDQQGVVEFSDQPGSGAKEIDIRPNVVDVAPVKSGEPSSSASATGAAVAPAGSVQPEVPREGVAEEYPQEGVADEYYGDYVNRRELPREPEQQMERREETVRPPVSREPGRGTVREGVHRR